VDFVELCRLSLLNKAGLLAVCVADINCFIGLCMTVGSLGCFLHDDILFAYRHVLN